MVFKWFLNGFLNGRVFVPLIVASLTSSTFFLSNDFVSLFFPLCFFPLFLFFFCHTTGPARALSLAARREPTVATRRTKRSVRLIATQNARSGSRRLISLVCVPRVGVSVMSVLGAVRTSATLAGAPVIWVVGSHSTGSGAGRRIINNTPYAPP